MQRPGYLIPGVVILGLTFFAVKANQLIVFLTINPLPDENQTATSGYSRSEFVTFFCIQRHVSITDEWSDRIFYSGT
jgi:hypothetical protein